MKFSHRILGFVLAMSALVGCSPNVCSGNSCQCPANATCDFGNRSAEASNFNCSAGSTCTGTTGASSNVTCAGVSCTVTVGTGSSVACSSGTCNITCQGQCTAQCVGGGTCNLTCGGGTTQTPAGCT